MLGGPPPSRPDHAPPSPARRHAGVAPRQAPHHPAPPESRRRRLVEAVVHAPRTGLARLRRPRQPRLRPRQPSTLSVDPRAGSGELLCEGREERAAVVVAQPPGRLGGGELAVGLGRGALAVRPPRLDRVQARALARQAAGRRPVPAALARRSWPPIRARTSRLTCRGASSRTRATARTPPAASRPAARARKARGTPLTGRPATTPAGVRPGSGSRTP